MGEACLQLCLHRNPGKTWVPGLRPGLQMQTRLPSRPTGTMPKNYHNHSVNVNKVLYVTMSCAVSMYAMLAAYGHQPVRDFDLLVSIKPTGDRKETKRPDPVPDDNEPLTEAPTGALC